MQLFRVKDCKQMAQKKADGISPSARLLLFSLLSPLICCKSYLVGGLALTISSLAVLVSAVALRDHTRTWLVGVRHSRTLSRYHYDALLVGDYSVNFRAPRFLWWRFASRFTQCSTYLYSTSLLRVGGNNPISSFGTCS